LKILEELKVTSVTYIKILEYVK